MEYEEDSYIDNSELYPDSLPPGQESEFGGFFVNCGKLRWKTLVDQPLKKPQTPPKKRNSTKKVVQEESVIVGEDAKDGVRPVCKKKVVAKSDANAKLDAIFMAVLKAQNPNSTKILKKKTILDRYGAFRSANKNGGNVGVVKHAFVSPRPRMQVSFGKIQPKM